MFFMRRSLRVASTDRLHHAFAPRYYTVTNAGVRCAQIRRSRARSPIFSSRTGQARGKSTRATVKLDDLPIAPLQNRAPLSPLSIDPGKSTARKRGVKARATEELGELITDGNSTKSIAPSDGENLLSFRRKRDVVQVKEKPRSHDLNTPDPLFTKDETKPKGRKKKETVRIDDLALPQGLIPLDPLPLEEDAPAYPTVILQAQRNMQKFENCVLLTRVGGFYELYFEHAEDYGPLMNLKVATKVTKAGSVPMAGFPFFQLDRYLKILVQDNNRYVAIAEEFPNDPFGKSKSGALMHDRKVTRIVTPGTLIDENFMDPLTNNYVLAVHVEDPFDTTGLSTTSSPMLIGLAWLDLSTGHFFTQTTALSTLPSFLARIAPREVVLDEDLQTSKEHGIFTVLQEEHYLISYINGSQVKPISEWSTMLESPIPPKTMNDFTAEEISAGSSLLEYVETRLQGSNIRLQPPTRQSDVMGIDKNTMRALEIRKTTRDDSFVGSLLHTIRRTNTKGGARLLDSWLTSPSTSLEIINGRLDLVTYIWNNSSLLERLKLLLKRSHDSHRLLQKFAFGRGDPDDLLDLAATISVSQDIVTTLMQDTDTGTSACVRGLAERIHIDGPSALAVCIRNAIDEEGLFEQHRLESDEAEEVKALASAIISAENSSEPSTTRTKKKAQGLRDFYSDESEVWIMKASASPTLQRLHLDLMILHADKQSLAASLCARLGATSLTLRFTPGLGHICHIKGKDRNRELSDDPELRSVGSSKSTRSFHHPEWTALGQRLDTCRTMIRTEEQRVFASLREQVILNITNLRRNAAVLDELDVACSFSTLAIEKHWTRPILNTSFVHKIIGGRHPTVEGGLEVEGRSFVTNDCFVGDVQRCWLITGPNMAGKSTFLRQNALITILAQVGSYVPAEYAEIGLVDQIFSRVGSADNLYRSQSTFMVEMLETALILRSATPRSFVIMDEIGRGTTPGDGTAVAFACLHHLYFVNKCRTLFATHYHVLADMVAEEGMEGIGFWCSDVKEEEGEGGAFRYVHRLRQGVNRNSHALKVAKLAGMPEGVLGVARRVLGPSGE